MKTLITILFLVSTLMGQVCVRPIHPAVTPEHVQVVLEQLHKKGVEAHQCGKAFEPIEIWFYPLSWSVPVGITYFWISANHSPGHITGSIMTDTPWYSGSSWEMSVHPYGGVWATKRFQSSSLKSESGKMGKWLKNTTLN